MGIGESIKKGFSTAMGSMPLVVIFIVYGAVTNLLNLAFADRLQSPTPDQNTMIASSALSILLVLFGIFLQAGSMGFLRDKLKTGTASLGAFAAYGMKYYLRLLAFGLIVSALVIGVILVAALALNALPEAARIVGVAVFAVIGLVVLYFVILMFFAPYIMVVEETGAVDALKRSMPLVKSHFGGVLLLGLALVAIGFLLGVLFGLVMGLVAVAMQGSNASQQLVAVLSSIVNGFLGVFMTAAYMNFYLRVRGGAPA